MLAKSKRTWSQWWLLLQPVSNCLSFLEFLQDGTCLPDRISRIIGASFFVCQVPFPSPNQQCHSAKWLSVSVSQKPHHSSDFLLLQLSARHRPQLQDCGYSLVHHATCMSISKLLYSYLYSLCLATVVRPGWINQGGCIHNEMIYQPADGYPIPIPLLIGLNMEQPPQYVDQQHCFTATGKSNCHSESKAKKVQKDKPSHTWYALMIAWTARWSSITLTSGMAWVTAPVAETVATATDLAPIAGDWLPGRIDGGDTYAEPGGAPSRALRKNTSHDCQRTKIILCSFTEKRKYMNACNTTGLTLRAAAWWVALHMRRRGVLQTTTDASDHHQSGPLHYV